jgi:hypothetical protein
LKKRVAFSLMPSENYSCLWVQGSWECS